MVATDANVDDPSGLKRRTDSFARCWYTLNLFKTIRLYNYETYYYKNKYVKIYNNTLLFLVV